MSNKEVTMTDLTDRMRTCAAHLDTVEISEILTDEKMEAIIDARKLLLEASDLLDRPIVRQQFEPMEIIPPVVTPPPVVAQTSAMWIGDDLKPIPNAPKSRSACPKCDSRAQKTVKVKGNQMWLICPVCEHAWTR